MTTSERTLRMNLLGGMNSYIINLGDEDAWETWIAEGVPDEATIEDLEFIAEDEEEWCAVCQLFGQLVNYYRK